MSGDPRIERGWETKARPTHPELVTSRELDALGRDVDHRFVSLGEKVDQGFARTDSAIERLARGLEEVAASVRTAAIQDAVEQDRDQTIVRAKLTAREKRWAITLVFLTNALTLAIALLLHYL